MPLAAVLVALVLEPLLVELPEIAPFEAWRLSVPPPEVDEVAPPPVPELPNDDVPSLVALPCLPAAAKAPVLLEVPVLFVALLKFAVPARDAAELFEALAFREPLAASSFVVPLDLLELAESPFVKLLDSLLLAESAFVVPLDSLAFAAKALVVPLLLVALLDSEADWSNEADLLAPACCMLLLVLLKLVAKASVVALSLVKDESLLAV